MAKSSSGWFWAWIHGWSHKRNGKAQCDDKKRECEGLQKSGNRRTIQPNFKWTSLHLPIESGDKLQKLPEIVSALNSEVTRLTGKKNCGYYQRKVSWRKEFNFLFKAVCLKEFFDLKKKTLKMSFSVDPSIPGEPGDEDLDNKDRQSCQSNWRRRRSNK